MFGHVALHLTYYTVDIMNTPSETISHDGKHLFDLLPIIPLIMTCGRPVTYLSLSE